MLEAEVARRRAESGAEIVRRERVKRDMEHLDRVNRRHPVEDAPSPEEIAQRHRWADEALRRDAERIAANEERWQREEAERAAAAGRGPRMQHSGSEGFTIKRGL
jgi:hypothetical protein